MIRNLINRLRHKHQYKKIAFRDASNRNVRYSERLYRCVDCGNERWVDGRNDPLEKKEALVLLEEYRREKRSGTNAH